MKLGRAIAYAALLGGAAYVFIPRVRQLGGGDTRRQVALTIPLPPGWRVRDLGWMYREGWQGGWAYVVAFGVEAGGRWAFWHMTPDGAIMTYDLPHDMSGYRAIQWLSANQWAGAGPIWVRENARRNDQPNVPFTGRPPWVRATGDR